MKQNWAYINALLKEQYLARHVFKKKNKSINKIIKLVFEPVHICDIFTCNANVSDVDRKIEEWEIIIYNNY